jgi:hypothetical protein
VATEHAGGKFNAEREETRGSQKVNLSMGEHEQIIDEIDADFNDNAVPSHHVVDLSGTLYLGKS